MTKMIWAGALAACGGSAQQTMHMQTHEITTVPAQPTTATPPTTNAPAVAVGSPPVLDIDGLSEQLAFRLSMLACRQSGTICEGPAELAVYRKDAAGHLPPTPNQILHLDTVYVMLIDAATPLVNDEEGVLQVSDFDFDGRDDFAVQVAHDGPYGSPTFAVYVDSPSSGSFVKNEALSQLTRTSLGLFQVDAARKRLTTYSKSGCCWHRSTSYELRHGHPIAVARVTDDATGVYQTRPLVKEERFIGGRWSVVKTERRLLDPTRDRRAPSP